MNIYYYSLVEIPQKPTSTTAHIKHHTTVHCTLYIYNYNKCVPHPNPHPPPPKSNIKNYYFSFVEIQTLIYINPFIIKTHAPPRRAHWSTRGTPIQLGPWVTHRANGSAAVWPWEAPPGGQGERRDGAQCGARTRRGGESVQWQD